VLIAHVAHIETMMKIPPAALAAIAFFHFSCIETFAIRNNGYVIPHSSELTPEETELLLELEDPSALYKPLEDLAKRTQQELDQLHRIEHESIPAFIQGRNEVNDKIGALNAKTLEFLSIVEDLNEMEISEFTDRLEESIESELNRRAKLPASDGDDMGTEETWPKRLAMKVIKEQIDINAMIEKPGIALRDHVYDILSDKWVAVQDDYLNKCKTALESKKNMLMKGLEKSTQTEKVNACVDASKAANKVLASLVALQNDEKESGVLTGASIVYGDNWTSDTYQPSLKTSDDASALKLGDARVRQYIPEDWERILPSGWKDWDASILQSLFFSKSPQDILPAYLWHSLPVPLVALVENSFQKAHPAPTETLFDANMHLGSCWKMSGRSGKVTLRLDEPAVIESITIDHYPWLPSAHNPKEYASHTSSAPRFMRLQGYQSCNDEEKCNSQLGFDDNEPVNYSSFEYKIDSLFSDESEFSDVQSPTSSSQTFPLSLVAIAEDEDDEDGFSQEGGCSAVKPTCDGAPGDTHVAVQAITLFIDQNWGNPDYTCIYRIRVNERE
jgi:hypothetical protein